jgi:ABC-type multidrug transport system ATPase subunit
VAEILYGLEDVAQIYGSRPVLSIKRLDLTAGQIYGVMGRNGSGKTTLLKILAFLESPARGKLYFKGDLVTPRDLARLRSQVVWAAQFPVMFSGSLRYNVEYPLKIRGLGSAQRREKALELLSLVGLRALAEAPAPKLSGGEAQRGALARALATGARILLLDEPTANVDKAARQDLVSLIEKLSQDAGLTVIIATHDQAMEERLCQTRLRLEDGQLVARETQGLYEAFLESRDSRWIARIPNFMAQPGQAFKVIDISLGDSSIQVGLLGENLDKITLKVTDPESLKLAQNLTLASWIVT